MFGGYGNDLLSGDMSADLMIGEYTRLTLEGNQAETVVRLGQRQLDLIASQQFGLYNPLALTPSLLQLGSVLQPRQLQQFIAAQRPRGGNRSTVDAPRSDFSSAAKNQGYGYHPPEEAAVPQESTLLPGAPLGREEKRLPAEDSIEETVQESAYERRLIPPQDQTRRTGKPSETSSDQRGFTKTSCRCFCWLGSDNATA
jgi:hypothetical protein